MDETAPDAKSPQSADAAADAETKKIGSAVADRPLSFHFSAAGFPENERAARFREEICQTLSHHVDVEPLSGQPLDVNWTTFLTPGFGVIACGNSPMRMKRNAAANVAAGCDGFILALNLDGVGQLVQRGRDVSFSAGEAVFMAHTEPGIFTHTGGAQIALAVSREALAPLVVNIDDLTTQVISRNNDALRLLRIYLHALCEEEVQMLELRRAATSHLHELMALALGATREAAERAQGRGLRAARQQAVLAEIRRGFADPAFSAAVVAQRLQLSQRYIQDLLHDTGMSFTERVMDMRLQKARDMIADDSRAHLTIGDIAHACGFNEIPYFNRSFRQRFGDAPTTFRARRTPG